MSKLYDHLMDLREQESKLVDQLYDIDQGVVYHITIPNLHPK